MNLYWRPVVCLQALSQSSPEGPRLATRSHQVKTPGSKTTINVAATSGMSAQVGCPKFLDTDAAAQGPCL